jgi:hypothetical protein
LKEPRNGEASCMFIIAKLNSQLWSKVLFQKNQIKE